MPVADVIVRIDLERLLSVITFRRCEMDVQEPRLQRGRFHCLRTDCTEAPRVELHSMARSISWRDGALSAAGRCTSPAITNILCRRLDARLQGAARKLGFEYSRYADDLLFSSKAEKPFAVAMRDLATRIIRMKSWW
jgi:hypothetical protein